MSGLPRKSQELIVIVSFMFIPVLLLLVFSYYPAVTLIYNSLTSWSGLGPKPWIGLKNYIQLFSDPGYFKILLNNFAYFIIGYVEIFLALYFAVLLNMKFKGRNFFKTLIFLPYIINSIAVAFMMTFVFDNSYGAINVFLRQIGLGNIAPNWVGNSTLVNYTFAFMSLWKYLGMTTVLFLAALQSIGSDIYEAAGLDGANAWQTFWNITLPGIWGMFQLTLFMNLSGAIGAFEFVFAIYPAGSPMGMADTFVIKTINTAFKFHNFGMASAMGVVLMAFTGVMVLAQFKLFNRGGD